jgi:hypothetical protein
MASDDTPKNIVELVDDLVMKGAATFSMEGQAVVLDAEAAKNALGIPEAIEAHKCGSCKRGISEAELRGYDSLTFKEYNLSSLCKACQDLVFKDPDESWGCICDEVDVGLPVMYHDNTMCFACPECGGEDYTLGPPIEPWEEEMLPPDPQRTEYIRPVDL